MEHKAHINEDGRESAIILQDLPVGIKPQEVFQELANRTINILAIYKPSQEFDKSKFTSKRCYYKLEDLVIKSNQHMIGFTQLKKSVLKTLDKEIIESYENDPVSYGIRTNKKKFIQDNDDTSMQDDQSTIDETNQNIMDSSMSMVDFIEYLANKNKSIDTNSCIVLLHDTKQNINHFLLKNIKIRNKPIFQEETDLRDTLFDKLLQSKKNFSYRGNALNYLTFDIGVVQAGLNDGSVFRTYWSLENVKTYGCEVGLKKAYFNIRNPEDSDLFGLLSFDLVFQVDKELEMRASFFFSHIDMFTEENKVYWIVHLVRHPECYFIPLRPDEYVAYHLKNWRRIPNFFLGRMADNIDRIYLANKSIVRLCFDKEYYKMFDFFKQYQQKLKQCACFNEIRPKITQFIKYSSLSLRFNSEVVEQMKVPFEIKFLIMVMISRGQLDPYSLESNFLDRILKPVTEKKLSLDTMRRLLEMIALNKDYDKKFLTYEDFKEVVRKCWNVAGCTEKLFGAEQTAKNSLTSFDAHDIYSFQLHISPSCTYYLCGDSGISKNILYKFSDHMERFLLVNFIDEDLEPIKSVRSVLQKVHYSNFTKTITLLNRKYDFFSVHMPQIEKRSFWMFYSDQKVKAQQIFEFLETGNSKTGGNLLNTSISRTSDQITDSMFYHMLSISDQLVYSFDTLDVEKEGIDIILIKMATNENTQKEQMNKPTFEGYISGHTLDEIANKFNYGNVPGIILRCKGQDLLLLRDPYSEFTSSIKIFEEVWNANDFSSVKHFEILEIPHYRPAFLDKNLIVLFESIFRADYRDEILDFYSKGVNVLIVQFLESLKNGRMDFFNKIISSSKFSNNIIQPLVSLYPEFDSEIFFKQLLQSIIDKIILDLKRKVKIYTEFGAYLLGIVDNTGNLKKGEIYYEIDNSINGKPSKPQNEFPHVAVARRPYLDHSMSNDRERDHRDLQFFEIKFNGYSNGNPFVGLKNCIIFSAEDSDFVNSCQNEWQENRSNYFLVFWQQHLLPERFRKTFEAKSNKKVEENKQEEQINQSRSHYYTEETKSDSEKTNQSFTSRGSDSSLMVAFNKYKDNMEKLFLTMIRNPPVKYIKYLHLAYADTSNSRCGDVNARFLSYCYRELSAMKQISENEFCYLINILESSRYLPVPNYISEIKSSQIIESGSLLNRLYINISLSIANTVSEKYETNVKIDDDLIRNGIEKYMKHALKIQILYNYDIHKLCLLYGCSSESDLLIGFNKKSSFIPRNAESPNFKRKFINLKDYIRLLAKKYRQLFAMEFKYTIVQGKIEIDSTSMDEALNKASAWYVCSLHRHWKGNEKTAKFINGSDLLPLTRVINELNIKDAYGMPWLAVNDLLMEIKYRKRPPKSETSF